MKVANGWPIAFFVLLTISSSMLAYIITTTISATAQTDDTLLPQIYEKSIRSIVLITVNIMIQGQPGIARGSGFVYDNSGHIITNNHVVEGGGDTVDVKFIDGNSYSAKVTGRDRYSDLAVLQVDPAVLTMEQAMPLPLGSSSAMKIGQHVISIGNPLGRYAGTMTEGIISQENLMILNPTGEFFEVGMIQFDAPITHGNSGGPLLNLNNQVIGVTSASSELATFIAFAIPSDTVKRVVPQLIIHGTYQHPWLGIGGEDITSDIAQILGLRQANGIIVTDVTQGSPAALAGITSGTHMVGTIGNETINSDADIILGVDNLRVRGLSDLLTYIDTKSVGDSVVLSGIRNGVSGSTTVHLTARP